MHAKLFSSVLLVVLASYFPFQSAASDQQAIEMLKRQLQFLSLADDPDGKFAAYYEQMTDERSVDLGKLSREITVDITSFWHDHGIQLKADVLYTNDSENLISTGAEPQTPGYLAFSNHIAQLIWMQNNYPWLPIKIEGLLQPGEQHSQVSIIEERLLLLGDLAEATESNSWLSPSLVDAIKLFQLRHGLKVDGVVGPETLRWLNTTPFQRAKLLAQNFVKRASYQSSIGSRYLLVNIPAFEMVLVDDNEEQLRSRVIVGKPYRQTPVLSSNISNIVLNPSWRVPRNIVYRDLLPHIRKDGTYIQQREFTVFDYQGNLLEKEPQEWQQLAAGKFPYRLVQKPGDLNALGRYKFHFANRHSVYLHDTPHPELFESANRALSSGCVRVESVTALANWIASNLVKDKQTWVEMQKTKQKTQWFSFKSLLPVHLVYWTAWVDELNRPQFRNDIYNMEQKETISENVITRR